MIKEYKYTRSDAMIGVFLLVNFFFPYYCTSPNGLNETFYLTCFFALLIMPVLCGEKNRNSMFKLLNLYLVICGIFFLLSMYINYKYSLNIGWIVINQTIGFLMFYVLCRFNRKECFRKRNLYNLVTDLFLVSNIISILYLIIGGEAIRFHDITVQFRRPTFMDKRLTFVYPHKSVYGLIILLVLLLILENKDISFRKIKIFILLITLFFTNSAVSIVSAFIAIMAFGVKNIWRKLNFQSRVLFLSFAFFLSGAIFFALLNVVGNFRDLNNLGGRLAIWKYAISYLRMHLIGIGDEFQSIFFTSSELEFSFNNFHNVFLNEMLQISVYSGILYILEYLIMCRMAIVFSAQKGFTILYLIIITLPLVFDQAITVGYFPLYSILFYFIFIYENDVRCHTPWRE